MEEIVVEPSSEVVEVERAEYVATENSFEADERQDVDPTTYFMLSN